MRLITSSDPARKQTPEYRREESLPLRRSIAIRYLVTLKRIRRYILLPRRTFCLYIIVDGKRDTLVTDGRDELVPFRRVFESFF